MTIDEAIREMVKEEVMREIAKVNNYIISVNDSIVSEPQVRSIVKNILENRVKLEVNDG